MKPANRQVVLWLLCGCFLIFSMVIIGGITRLTGSGLSITEWKPIVGIIPPLNDIDWEIAFEKYKQIPQFRKINYDYKIDDFKSIFWWDYFHRLLGRIIGIVFIIPFIWFYLKGNFDKRIIKKMIFLFLLGALQGIIGWLMVESGLSERTNVSHIRLALHLITAFITFGFTFYFALEIQYGETKLQTIKSLNRLIKILFITVIIQIIYGAFVAGLHAGKIYNTFPLMNGKLIPDGMLFLKPTIINFFDNHTLVQFIHRFLAGTIVILSFFLFYLSRINKMNSVQKKGILYFLCAVFLQFILGIFTLLTSVEIKLAVLHQAGALILFSTGVYLLLIFRKNSIPQ